MPKSIDVIFEIIFPEIAAHVLDGNGTREDFLVLRQGHLAMTSASQSVFKGAMAKRESLQGGTTREEKA